MTTEVKPNNAEAKGYHHGDLKTALLDAARSMIAEKGLNNFSLRKVGQVVGVSQTALYRHFSGKDDLLASVAEQGFLEMAAAVEGAYQNAGRVDEQMQACGLAYVHYGQNNPNLYRLMFDSSLSDSERFPDLSKARRQVFKWPMKCVSQMYQDRGLSDDLLQESNKVLIQAMVHGLSSLIIENLLTQKQSQEKVVAEVIALMRPFH